MRTRSVGLNVRVSPAEKQRIQTAARRCGLTLSEYLRQRALGYAPRFHPPQAFFSYLTWMDNLTDQLARLDPPLAEQYRRCREGLLDSLLRKEDASGDH
ncbi:MAG TPA: toxin-antitoxin system protein [Candidatus Fournierella excrementavium]|uniref:plasmid mobilization protein n=1 Tax=Candidatus Allofournierella excrementavium TaxID=2838591 RepID=UPI001F8BF32F|nr:toxin-antitoxin system protein [Candidatus Fournierella excrementavium]